MSVEEETRPVQLLLRAVDELPKADRERVLLWLLDPTARNSGGLWALRSYTAGIAARVPELSPKAAEAVQQQLAAVDPRKGEQLQVVPVRLTAEQHARLRAWCAAHDFSMATVIRGLVDQFLENQAERG